MDRNSLREEIMRDAMLHKYERCRKAWNEIFSNANKDVPSKASTGNEIFDSGIEWVCAGVERILDFGCGDGTLLFICALLGMKYHIGIDFSDRGIEIANNKKTMMPYGEYEFICGNIEKIGKIEDSSIDAVILSNIVDNLYPEDADMLLSEVSRVLKGGGRVLVKLNPCLTAEQSEEWHIKVIRDNLLDDGLILWNNTTDEWREFFARYFCICDYREIYYPEYQQTNRMFLLKKNEVS